MSGFEFFRERRQGYAPRTPAGALRAIGAGIVPVEHFVYASVSAKPMDEEPLDLDMIERVLARRDLTLQTKLLLKGVFQRLINSREQEVALLGAEGISALEARYVKRIEELKADLAKEQDPAHLRTLGRLYFELAELHGKESSIHAFYLREAFSALRKAHGMGRISRSSLALMIDILISLGLHAQAAMLLGRVRAADDPLVLLLAARIAFHQRDYRRVMDACRKLAPRLNSLSRRERSVVSFWTAETAQEAPPSA